jgi:2-amino-4-hydroxy-6-hydroxymethyldihydropteridine diphosphokinase
VLAFIGLGSNLGDCSSYLERAIDLLRASQGIRVIGVSTFRKTDPVGHLDQPPFLNGAVAVETEVGARELLDRLLAIERELGRERAGPRFGPRTIDLDLLLYGEEVIDEPGLKVPHPRLGERAFVLEPLVELDPGLRLPDGRLLTELLPS